ncbi:hypothetical protein CSA37_05660 [Candidatus Fermentibacteria bacterium]|nr:MAG: hypothetical protein CSA37_05660 [Candidatus Fermentibacteria bacterium]
MVRCTAVLAAAVSVLFAQNYDFSVPEFNCIVEINRDRSLNIYYDMVFECTSGFHAVDIVDIGFPSDDFSLSSTEAWMDGHQITDIYHSSYIDNGVEVHLGGYAVHSGETGRFSFKGRNENMVFLDTEDDDYASMEFSPTWFDGSILSGSSDFTLRIVFPEGAEPSAVRYHEVPFTFSSVDKAGRVVYEWHETRRVDSPFQAGVSFPDDLVEGPLTERPKEPWISREALFAVGVFGLVVLFFVSIIVRLIKFVVSAGKRREQYLPPKLGLEGSGVRRGLTAPMAALLMEEKLDRVFLLIVFGMLKKGVLQLDGKVLKKTGVTEGLRPYEKALLAHIPLEGRAKPLPASEIKELFTEMIKQLGKKMRDYSLKETREYYRSIIDNAWKMASSDMSAERAGDMLRDRFQWMLADNSFDKRISGFSERQNVIVPTCMYSCIAGSINGSGSGGMGLSEACSQVAGALEGAAKHTVSGITSLSRSVTSVTNPVPVSSYSSSGSSCACACAGCACACAGGGR